MLSSLPNGRGLGIEHEDQALGIALQGAADIRPGRCDFKAHRSTLTLSSDSNFEDRPRVSEYQYYEFQAIDRPLDRATQEELRSISSRARITATSFANSYEWGDLRGDPSKFVERWFDLHLYLADWGTRRLMMRVPERFLNRAELDPFLAEVDWAEVRTSGGNAIIDICPDEMEPDGDWDDGSGWLAALAPLRADVLSGDLRLFYLLWLMAVEYELISDDDVEPLPGIGPLTGALQAFAEFFGIDRDLVHAAADVGADEAPISEQSMREALTAFAEDEKTELLLRVVEGDTHVAAELRRTIRNKHKAPPIASRRTVGQLRTRAQEIRQEHERAEAERLEAEQRRQAEEAAMARGARLIALKRRGASVWQEVEDEIARRNPSGYDKAVGLLSDLEVLSAQEGNQDEFARRLASIRSQHDNKRKFIERLDQLGLEGDDRTP